MSRKVGDSRNFPVRPVNGRYLWGWPNRCSLEGEGFTPESTPGHHFITRASLEAVPLVRTWMGDEAELLIWTYCAFPDMNWEAYGRFNSEHRHLARFRLPDYRRAWHISAYCGYNPITGKGDRIPVHHPPDSWRAFVKHYRRACSAAQRGKGWDAVRLLGVALHFLQDGGCPAHVANMGDPLHRIAECVEEPDGIGIPGYRPTSAFDPTAAAKRLSRFVAPLARKIVRRLERDAAAEILPIQIECANACAKATADTLADFRRRFAERVRFRSRPARRNVELLVNGDFSLADDEPFCPAGWVMKWWDRTDRNVAIERRRSRGGWWVVAERVGDRVACMTTWPRAVRVRPGEVYCLRGCLGAPKGDACGLYAEIYDGATRKLEEWNAVSDHTGKTRHLEGKIAIREGGRLLRVGVYAQRMPGPARFASLSLIRL